MLLLFNQAIFNEIKIFKDINFISKSQTRDQRIQYVKRLFAFPGKFRLITTSFLIDLYTSGEKFCIKYQPDDSYL